jgi:glycosyltransferase involved in cell wall biosynthesis
MTSRSPAVTVLLPVYNDEQRVRSAIDSVLRQTFADFELLVIDDGSTDGTPAVLQGFADRRLRVIRNRVNRGLPDSLNLGLAEAKGGYVARMDSDDICLPPRLAAQVAYLDTHPKVDVCGSWVEPFGTGREEVWEYPAAPAEVRAGLLFRPTIAHPTAMLRKASFAAADLKYDPAFRSSEDYDFWARASEQLVLANVPQVLLRYRLAPPALDKAGIKEEYANRTRSRLLGRLGIEATPEELVLHGQIARCETSLDANFLAVVDAWLQRLEQANSAAAVYPPDVLRRLLAHRFWRLCSQAADLGSLAWSAFRQSCWRRDAGVPLGTLLRFYWRCHSGSRVRD